MNCANFAVFDERNIFYSTSKYLTTKQNIWLNLNFKYLVPTELDFAGSKKILEKLLMLLIIYHKFNHKQTKVYKCTIKYIFRISQYKEWAMFGGLLGGYNDYDFEKEGEGDLKMSII